MAKIRKIVITAVLLAAGVTCAVVFSFILIANVFDLSSSRKEYSYLSEFTKTPGASSLSSLDSEMRGINPDYLCWITIEGTRVDYPVVRGADNEKYLNMSFFSEENIYGTLFLDYRCIGETVPHLIIYGHNAKTGDMFGDLHLFLNSRYMEEHPAISLTLGEHVVEYEIFAARSTDVHDIAYTLNFGFPGSFGAFAESCGAPLNTEQIITLSTCVSGNDKDERIIVQGAFHR